MLMARNAREICNIIKIMNKHLERVWENIVNLFEDEFPLPVQTLAIPSVCPPKELPSSSTYKPLLYHLCALLKIFQVLILVKPL